MKSLSCRDLFSNPLLCLDYGAGFGENTEPERITASIGASVDLPCRLPRGSAVTWRKDGGALPASSRQIQTVLRIDRVTEQDTGRYICSGPAGTQYTLLSVQRKSDILYKEKTFIFQDDIFFPV